MHEYIIEYTLTQRTIERIPIEADTPEEAIRLVEEYNFDNSHSWQIDSLEYSVSDVHLGSPQND